MPMQQMKPAPRAASSINPATGKLLKEYPYTAPREVEAQLAQAAKGFIQWRGTSMTSRVQSLHAMAAALRDSGEAYATLITSEMGKPFTESRAEIEKCAKLCEWYAENGPALLANEPVTIENSEAYVAYAPLGTVLGVMPWNFPFWQVMRASVPIMLGGNGFLLKHASNVVGCAYALEEAWNKAGLPTGLFQVLNVASSDIEAIIADDRIAAVTLTGSKGAGAAVAAAAGKAIKKSVLELGGSDPFIVLADADIDAAVEAAIKARFSNAGQVCIAAKRFLIEKPIAHSFTDKFIAAARNLNIGDPMLLGTKMGPLARADLRDDLDKQVRKTLAQGATLLLGGKKIDGAGFYYEPTILSDVSPDMCAFTEETFGPLAAITVVADANEAIRLANQSEFGLSSNLWSGNIERAKEIAAQLETGGVFINNFSASDPRIPIGGIKQSGYGRELSHFGIHEFMNAKTVWIKK